MSNLREFAIECSPGVFHCRKWGTAIKSEAVQLLIVEARHNPRYRARLCLHPTPQEAEQQMLIVMVEGAIDAPHMHPHKREALVPILGTAEYQEFDDTGAVQNRILLGQQETMYVSSPLSVFHRVVLLEPVFAFWEFSVGPFTQSSTIPAPWLDQFNDGSGT